MAVLFVITFAINLVAPQYAAKPWTELVVQSLAVLCGAYNLLGSGSYYYDAMWSLSVEEQFYLAAPALIGVFRLGLSLLLAQRVLEFHSCIQPAADRGAVCAMFIS